MIAQDTTHATHTITYFINGQVQHTTHHELSVRAILQNGGFSPSEQYRLIRDHGDHKYTNLDEEVHLTNHEKFTAIFEGPTPVS